MVKRGPAVARDAHVIGVALGPDSLVAVRKSPTGDVEHWRAHVARANGPSWPELRETLRRLAVEWCGSPTGARPLLRIALLAPLAEVRTVSIPPVGDDDARRLLTQAVTRHFLEIRGAAVVGMAPATPGADTPGRLAAAVSAPLLRAIHTAAHEAGFEVPLVVPAVTAWTLACGAPVAFVVQQLAWQEVIVASNGVPRSVRRFRVSGDEAAIADAIGALASNVIADPALTAASALAVRGPLPSPVSLALPVGAHGAPIRKPGWRAPLALAVAAALMVAVVALREFAVRRDLTSVRAERARLAPVLALHAPDHEATAIRRALDEASASRWSPVLVEVADALPDDAHLLRLSARGDTLVLTGIAASATAAFDALAAVPIFADLVASAPVRRETTVEGDVTERFEFTVRLATPAGAAGKRPRAAERAGDTTRADVPRPGTR